MTEAAAPATRPLTRSEIVRRRRIAKRQVALLYRQRNALIRMEAGITEFEQAERELAAFAAGDTHTRAWRLGSPQDSR